MAVKNRKLEQIFVSSILITALCYWAVSQRDCLSGPAQPMTGAGKSGGVSRKSRASP